MSSAPTTKVLSEALEEAVGGGRVRAAVFVTFRFDPEFFEHAVLPCLFGRGFSTDREIRRVQVGEALRGVDHVAVYFEKSGLVPTGAARLDYRRVGISKPKGILHAKHVLLLVEDEAEDDAYDSTSRLVMITTSANLTDAGWRRNVEVAHVHQLHEGDAQLLRDDLLGKGGLFSALERLDRTKSSATAERDGLDGQHAALDMIRAFVRDKTESKTNRKWGGVFYPRLWRGECPLPEFLAEHGRGMKLEIISPYFDNQAEAKTLAAVLDAVEPEDVRLMLPFDAEGKALCGEAYFGAVERLDVAWGKLPDSYSSYGRGSDDGTKRTTHAKVYRMFSPAQRHDVLVIGSPNLTGHAHQGVNFETAILIDLSDPKTKPDWWMERLVVEEPQFAERKAEDALEPSIPISVRFSWQTGKLSYFWEGPSPAPWFELRRAPQTITRVLAPSAEAWTPILDVDEVQLRGLLRATALLEVATPDGCQSVLVQETQMDAKPSLVRDLSPEKILEYWSLLSTDEQDAFLDRELSREVRAAKDAASNGPGDEERASMFDRFAGIFHGFSQFDQKVASSFEAGTVAGLRQARYLLFGQGHDSLGSLVTKVDADTNGDPVNRYFSLLCARQSLTAVRDKRAQVADECTELLGLVGESLTRVRDRLSLGTPAERDKFLGWLERGFFEAMVPVELGAEGAG